MELQKTLPEFEAHGIVPVAISYDPVGVLKAFAGAHGIRYPLLSDEGSQVIRALGLLNEHLDRDHAAHGTVAEDYQRGVPYPGRFVLDGDGRVTQKRFFGSYRERETGAGTLRQAFGVESSRRGRITELRRAGVTARAHLDADEYRSYQRLWLTVELDIDAGLHVYGRPIPAGFIPLSVTVASQEGVVVGDLEGPEPHPFRVAGLDERLLAHEGRVTFALPVTIMRRAGDITLDVTLRYQACSNSDCLTPEAIPFTLSVKAQPHAEMPVLPK